MSSTTNDFTWQLSESELRPILKSRLCERVADATTSRSGPSDYDLNPDFSDAGASKAPLIPAAVLIAIRFNPNPTVLFTTRTPHLNQHGGQVSFPGGKIDASDADATDAALRETHEELGIPRDKLDPQGFVDNYETATGFIISPLVAILESQTQIQPNPDEVAGAFDVPLAFLMNPQNRHRHTKQYRGKSRYFYAMPYQQYYIWGATAGILVNMQERLFGA